MADSNSLNIGTITDDSRVIFKEYFNHTGYADRIALRDEIIRTDDAIGAIRATDISGQNGIATIAGIGTNFVQLVFASDGVGRGFDFKVEIYSNFKTNEPSKAQAKNIWNCWSCCE